MRNQGLPEIWNLMPPLRWQGTRRIMVDRTPALGSVPILPQAGTAMSRCTLLPSHQPPVEPWGQLLVTVITVRAPGRHHLELTHMTS